VQAAVGGVTRLSLISNLDVRNALRVVSVPAS